MNSWQRPALLKGWKRKENRMKIKSKKKFSQIGLPWLSWRNSEHWLSVTWETYLSTSYNCYHKLCRLHHTNFQQVDELQKLFWLTSLRVRLCLLCDVILWHNFRRCSWTFPQPCHSAFSKLFDTFEPVLFDTCITSLLGTCDLIRMNSFLNLLQSGITEIDILKILIF